jgi:hypothetical protein
MIWEDHAAARPGIQPMKLYTLAVLCLSGFIGARATIPVEDQQPAARPQPNISTDYLSLREADRKKPGEHTIREVFVRNHHTIRAIKVFVEITWLENAGSEIRRKDVVVTLKPGEERSIHWFYPTGHGVRDGVFATILNVPTAFQ